MKSLNFLSILRRETRQFAVIGLGRFGRSVCRNLHKLGYEVLGTVRYSEERVRNSVKLFEIVRELIGICRNS